MALSLNQTLRYLLDSHLYDAGRLKPSRLFGVEKEMFPANSVETEFLTELEPGITYRIHRTIPTDLREAMKQMGVQSPHKTLPANAKMPIGFVGFKDMPMGDWDWNSSVHPGATDIESIADAVDRLQRRVTNYPDERYKIYVTPGGVRSWQISKPTTPTQAAANNYFNDLQMDRSYADISMYPNISKYATPEAARLIFPKFSARVTSKPQRAGSSDFVAYPIGEIGTAGIDPEQMRKLRQYHDRPIKRYIEQNHGQLNSQSVLDTLERYLGDVPVRFRNQVEASAEDLLRSNNPYYQ
jgi:hypothetical protein